jgi:hypothetical protein
VNLSLDRGRLTVLVEGVAHVVAAGELMRVAPEIRRQLATRTVNG